MKKEDAYKVALEHISGGISHCEETEKYWIFSNELTKISIGGTASPVAIEKKTGKPLFTYTLCLIHNMITDSPTLRTYSVSPEGKFTLE